MYLNLDSGFRCKESEITKKLSGLCVLDFLCGFTEWRLVTCKVQTNSLGMILSSALVFALFSEG